MNYFDIAIIVIVLLTAVLGFAKGFLKTLSSLFSWVISVIISILLAKVVANMLVGIPFVSKYFFGNPDGFSFAAWIYDVLPDNLQIDMNTVRNWLVVDGQVVDGAADVLIDNVKGENTILGIILGLFKGTYIQPLVSAEVLSYDFSNLGQALSILLANSLLIFFTGILLLIVFKIIINIIIKLLEKRFHIKNDELSFVNRLLGLLTGAAKGVLTCGALFVTLSFLITFPFMGSTRKMLLEDESIVAGKMATFAFGLTDTLLKEQTDLTIMLMNCGYDKTINLEEADDIEGHHDDEEQENSDQLEVQTISFAANQLALAA